MDGHLMMFWFIIVTLGERVSLGCFGLFRPRGARWSVLSSACDRRVSSLDKRDCSSWGEQVQVDQLLFTTSYGYHGSPARVIHNQQQQNYFPNASLRRINPHNSNNTQPSPSTQKTSILVLSLVDDVNSIYADLEAVLSMVDDVPSKEFAASILRRVAGAAWTKTTTPKPTQSTSYQQIWGCKSHRCKLNKYH